MSKSRGNAVDPWEAIAEFGADPLRWYLITVSNPWVPKRYDPEGVREAARRLFDTVLNSYRFFALYGNVEGWAPSDADPAPAERGVLDRWLLSRLDATVAGVGEEMEGYQLTRACRLVQEFVNEDLSNWYVRRSRPRFWGNADPEDARAAFRTLHEALVTVARLVAPVVPFLADWLHRALDGGASVHLAAFPTPVPGRRDEALEAEMAAVRGLVSLGRAAREEVRIRVRQPLRTLHAVVPEAARPRSELLELLRDELNVKEVRFLARADELVRLVARPNFRALGPRFQKRSEAAAAAIRSLDGAELLRFREGGGATIAVEGETVPLEPEWLEIVEEAAGEWVVKAEAGYTAALDPALDDALRAEGMARELVNRIQRLRKEAGLEITDRIRVRVGGGEAVEAALQAHRDFIAGETLALEVEALEGEGTGDGGTTAPLGTLDDEIDGIPLRVVLRRAE